MGLQGGDVGPEGGQVDLRAGRGRRDQSGHHPERAISSSIARARRCSPRWSPAGARPAAAAAPGRVPGRGQGLHGGAEQTALRGGAARRPAGRRRCRRGRRRSRPGRSTPVRAGPPGCRRVVRRGHQLARALQQHGGPGLLHPGAHRPDRVLGDPGALLAEQLGQLAGVRGEQPVVRAALGQEGEPVGVDHRRQPGVHRGGDLLRAVDLVAPAGPEQVGLHPPGREDHVGQLAADQLGGPVGAQEAHHPGPAVDRPVVASTPAPGVLVRSGVHAHDPAGVLVAAGIRVGPAHGQLVLVRRLQPALARPARAGPSPMSTTSTSPHRLRAGSSRWHGLAHPEGHGRRASIAAPGTAPVSAATPGGQVDGDDRVGPTPAGRRPGRRPARAARAGRRCPGPRRRPGRCRAARAAGCAGRGDQVSSSISINRPPAARSAASPRACGSPRQRTAVTATPRRASRAPANSASPPLFPGPDHDQDLGAVDPAAQPRQLPGHRGGQPGGRPLHQHVGVAHPLDRRRLEGADRLDPVRLLSITPRRSPRPRRCRRRGTG